MTNDQQTIVGQVSGSEAHQLSQQDNIQLTELLPVEQSRIKDNPDYRDQETTDGLRALRSFTHGERKEDFVQQSEFDYFRKIDKSYEPTIEIGGTTRLNGLRKRKNANDTRLSISRITRSASLENGGVRKNERSIRPNRRKNYLEDESSEDETVNKNDLKSESEIVVNGPDSSRLEDEDEVYYYRQQQPKIFETSNKAEKTNLEILSAGVYRDMANKFSEGTREKDSSKRTRGKRSKKVTKTGKKKKLEKGKKKQKIMPIKETETKKGSSSEIPEEAEKNLRLKIDGIIETNDLLEQENNNVVQTNQNVTSDIVKTWKERVNDMESSRIELNIAEVEKSIVSRDKDAKTYCCLMCPARFKGNGGLRNHYKVVHSAGPAYKCNECGKEFPLKERLKLHVRTHTGFKPYKCPDCHKTFARGGQLVQHRGTHSNVKPYHCHLCNGTFTCAANLTLHVKRHNGQKDHKCEICGRGFVRKDALKKHLECLHRDVKSFLCVICNKTFKGHLPQHMRTHAQDRPHGCATCGQRFAQKSQLTVHQRTHSGQRPFRCLVCWQAFAHSTALKLHTRRHTGERPFKCTECNAGFTQLPHWKKHMKCIHGRSEPYSCKNCKSFFRIKNDLENHEKGCHVGENVDDVATKSGQITMETTSTKSNNILPSIPDPLKFRVMSVERMRLLLAVLLKRISKPEKLDELGFGKRLIDEVLQDSLISAGKEPTRIGELSELESLRKNLETFLKWTVPKEHWENFRKMKKTPEEILETLTAT